VLHEESARGREVGFRGRLMRQEVGHVVLTRPR
jgi:hypothetical protein